MPRTKKNYRVKSNQKKRISKRSKSLRKKSKKTTKSSKSMGKRRSKSRFSVVENVEIKGKGSFNNLATYVNQTRKELKNIAKTKQQEIDEFNKTKLVIFWPKIIYDAISEREYRLRFSKDSENSFKDKITFKPISYTIKTRFDTMRKRYAHDKLKLTTPLKYHKDNENNETPIMKLLDEAYEQIKVYNDVYTPLGTIYAIPQIDKSKYNHNFKIGDMNKGEMYEIDCKRVGYIPTQFKVYLQKI